MPLHHYVPQFLLRGFADENDQLVTTMRSDFQASHKAVVRRAAAEKGYYRIPLEWLDHETGGVQDPEFIEGALADFEGLAAQDVQAIVAGEPITPAVHARLATFIGLQLTRTPRFRTVYMDVANVAARRVVKKITDERLHKHLTELGRPNSPQDVSRLRNEVFDAEFTLVPSAPQLVQDTLRHGLETLFPHLVSRTPRVLRFSQPLLLTSDAGAAPWSPGDPAPWSSGIANAHTVFLPLNRFTVLALTRGGSPSDRRVQSIWADHSNFALANAAVARIYQHPNDNALDRINATQIHRDSGPTLAESSVGTR